MDPSASPYIFCCFDWHNISEVIISLLNVSDGNKSLVGVSHLGGGSFFDVGVEMPKPYKNQY